MLKRPVILPIFHDNDYVQECKVIGMEHTYSECDIRPITFLNIDAIGPHFEKSTGTNYSSIFVGDNEFLCSISYAVIMNLLPLEDVLDLTSKLLKSHE